MKKPMKFIKAIVNAVIEELQLPENAIIQELDVKLTKKNLPVISLKVTLAEKE